MPEFISFGETMATFAPTEKIALRYVRDFKLRMAGAESNTAIGVAKLGHSAAWFSRLGEDELGAFVLNSIRAEGVDTSRVKLDSQFPTGVMIKETKGSETSVYYYRSRSAASKFSKSDIDFDYIQSAKIVHITGITPVLSDACHEATLAIVDFCIKRGIKISFDPNIRRKLWGVRDYSKLLRDIMFRSNIVMLGISEAESLLGTSDVSEITDILRSHGVELIAIKDGARGAWCADSNELLKIAPEPCNPIDPIGAGDGFNAGFLSGILSGQALSVCGRMGAIAGAMATESTGDVEGYPTSLEMNARLNGGEAVYR